MHAKKLVLDRLGQSVEVRPKFPVKEHGPRHGRQYMPSRAFRKGKALDREIGSLLAIKRAVEAASPDEGEASKRRK
jgi:hypothetical protein